MTSYEIRLGHSSRGKFGDWEGNSGIIYGVASALVDMCYKNYPIIDISSHFCLYLFYSRPLLRGERRQESFSVKLLFPL